MMLRILSLTALLSLPFSAQAQNLFSAIKDPHPGEASHYQNDISLPVQDRLEDCWAFTAPTWQKPLTHWTRTLSYLCKDIARKNAVGTLNAHDKAMEDLLLRFEASARAWSIHSIEESQNSPFSNDDAEGNSALLLRSSWVYLDALQVAVATDVGLVDVLMAMGYLEDMPS